jgi:Predicted nucleotidyltransferases
MLTVAQIQKSVTDVAKDFNVTSTDGKIRKISLFGSYASQQAHEGSDVDLLVEFNSEFVSFLSFGRLLTNLEDALKVPVDVIPSPLPDNAIISIEKTVPLYVEN